jgi:hypothetical protein
MKTELYKQRLEERNKINAEIKDLQKRKRKLDAYIRQQDANDNKKI